jgi:hypothetical protein
MLWLLTVLAVGLAFRDRPAPAVEITFAYSPDAAALVQPLIERFNAEHPSVHVNPVSVVSGDAEQRISSRSLEATAWLPATALWIGVLNTDTDATWSGSEQAPSVVKSPVVFAVWPSMSARGLGDPVRWSSVLEGAVAGSRNGRRFTLSLTDVDVSTSGLFAAISVNSTICAASGCAHSAPPDLTDPDVDQVQPRVALVQRRLAHYLAKASDFCPHLVAQGGHFSTVMFMQETTFVLCNRSLRGANRPILNGSYPSGGAFVADYPYVVLSDAPWMTDQQADAASEFGDWLRGHVAAPAARLGYRMPETFRQPPPGGVPGAPEATLTPPTPEVLGHLRGSWRQVLPGPTG